MKENVLRGALYVLAGAFFFALMGLQVKILGPAVSDTQIIFVRNAVGLLCITPFMFFPKKIPFSTPFYKGLLIRAISNLLTAYCFFYAIHHIFLADAMLLNNTMPLFVPFILFFWKGESIPKGLYAPLLVSFIGILLIVRPSSTIFHSASVIALLSGLFMAIGTCGTRELGKTEPTIRILFYLFAIAAAFTFIPLFWAWQKPTLVHAGLLVGVGICGMLYQLFIILGYKLVVPSKLSPLTYFAVILSGFFDWLFWNQIPHYLSFVGLILVVIGTYFCMNVEHKIHPNE